MASGKPKADPDLCTLPAINPSEKATEWSFRFENGAAGSETTAQSDFLIVFPPHLGGFRQRAQLCGEWTALIEPDGDLYVTDLRAELSSFPFPLFDPETEEIHWVDTGRLEVTLMDPPLDKSLAAKLGVPNTGEVDFDTGVARVTWGFQVHSPQLHALDIDPIPIVLTEVGFLDRKSAELHLAGTGLVTAGLFTGVFLLCGNPAKPVCTLSVSMPNPVSNGANTVTIRYTETPPSGTPVTFNLSGLIVNLGGVRGTATVPATVSVTGPGTATATLTLARARANSTVRVTASGGGQSANASSRVV